ncbi:MAG: hypothetical protein F6K21_12405 [Symploca sp. SIO2D2]|nr:hypothetical protein [Symploca sp. SIO2D2]
MTNGNMKECFKIFPPIGIARVGNSEQFYLAPEEPGGLPIPLKLDGDAVQLPIVEEESEKFREHHFRERSGDGENKINGKMCRQGVRFRIYYYKDATDTKPQEVIPGASINTGNGKKKVAQITWKVWVANKKASWYEFRAKDGEDGYSPNHPLRNSDITGDERKQNLILNPGEKEIIAEQGATNDTKKELSFTNSIEALYPQPPEVDFTVNQKKIETLGEICLDKEGRLVFVGGYGRSGSINQNPQITNYANNDGWFDDTSDGTVSAEICFESNSKEDIPLYPAWVLVAPPSYVPQIRNLVTLYDVMFDVAVRHMAHCTDIYENAFWKHGYEPNFQQEIQPILERASLSSWVTAMPPKPHTFDEAKLSNPESKYNGLRQYFFTQIRPPNQKNDLKSKTTGYPMMPYLAGDDCAGSGQKSSKYLTVTDTQYFLLQQWANGKFGTKKDGETSIQPEDLTIASLENGVGGAFVPGIEMTWICRNPKIYSEPFRIKHNKELKKGQELSLDMNLDDGLEPGDITKFMAIPWQGDFNLCSIQPIDRIVWWWPAQRPLFVYKDPRPTLVPANSNIPSEVIKKQQVAWIGSSYDQKADDYLAFPDDIEMVDKWYKLGFVFDIGPQYFVPETGDYVPHPTNPGDYEKIEPYYAEVQRSTDLPYG